METILIVDDDAGFRKLLESILAGEGYGVEIAASVREAIGAGERRNFHVVLANLRLPDGDGLEVLRWFAERSPDAALVMIAGSGAVSTAVEAMKLGAAGYVAKPLSSPEELRITIRKTLDQCRMAQERELLREQESARFNCYGLIAADPKMTELLDAARKAVAGDVAVLITGESGTGKEALARNIHFSGSRAQNAFVPVKCASAGPVAESDLFGHEKGAVAGTASQHVGRLERAHRGTIFLEEVADFDSSMQGKLLRVLQDRTFERLGGTRHVSVDVRVIAATTRDLKGMVAEGRFREDLYSRLNAFPLAVPRLRDRRGDIVPLARYFLACAARDMRKPELALTQGAENALLLYEWPGNVRELRNVMERVALLGEGRVEARDLPIGAPPATDRPLLWKDIERRAIEDALRMNGGNRTRAARQLGISLRTLQYRLKEWSAAQAQV
jgi:two-component system response regulator FlrC